MLNPDFRDILSALNAERAEYLVVGAYAMAAHGYPRATGDIDIWIHRSTENAERVWRALERFGAPLFDLTVDELSTSGIVFQIGVAPRRIDILTSLSGIEFNEAWPMRRHVTLDGVEVAVLGQSELLRNKRASGRPKDLADVAWLESHTRMERDDSS